MATRVGRGPTTDQTAEASSLKVRRRRRRREVRFTTVLLGCGIAAVVGVRWWASRKATDIQVLDEAGYLAVARFFAHVGVHWNMGTAGSYSPGYAVLLTPLYWLGGGSGSAIYRHAIWLNVALGAVPLLLLYVLARRITDLSPPIAAVVAAAISLAPAVVGHSALVWSESLVPATFLVLLLASLHLVRHPSRGAAVAVALMAAFAYAVHTRLLPSAVVALGLIAVLGLQRRLRVRWAATTVIGALLLIVGVRRGMASIDHTLYAHFFTQDTIRLSRFTHIGTILVEAAGQFWYLLVTTAGLVGFGVLALVRVIRDETKEATPKANHSPRVLDRPQALVIAAECGIAVLTSIVVAAGGERADQVIFGRYNDAVIGPLLILGIAALCQARPIGRRVVDAGIVIGATIALAAVLWGFRQHDLAHHTFYPVNVFGLVPLMRGSLGVHVVPVTLIGLALIAGVVLVAALRSRALVVVALTAAAVVGTVHVTPSMNHTPSAVPVANIERVSEVLPAKTTVLYSLGPSTPAALFYQLQLHLPDMRLELDTHRRQPAAAFAMSGNTDMSESGARLASVSPYTGIGLWVLPGKLQDNLDQQGQLLPAGFPAPLPPEAMQGRVTFASKPHLVDHGRRVRASVRVDRIGRGSPWPVHQGATDTHGTVRLAISVTDPQCRCEVRTGRADFSKMVSPGHHRVNVDVDELLSPTQRLHPGPYQIQVQLVQEYIQFFGTPAQATADLSH